MIKKVRRLRLRNDRGDVWDMNKETTLGYSPDSLGVRFDKEYEQMGNDFIGATRRVSQSDISITLVFGIVHSVDTLEADAYQRYFMFSEFLNFPPYVLEYETSAGLFYKDVSVASLGKTETNTFGLLEAPLVLRGETLWYREITEQDDEYIHTTGGGKILDMRSRPYIYEKNRQVTKPNELLFYNPSMYHDRDEKSPFEITITGMDGTAEYPGWELWVNDKLVQSDRVFFEPSEHQHLVVSSFPTDQKVVVSEKGKETSIYDLLDLSKTNFLQIPQGDSKLVMRGFTKEQVKFRLRYEWVTV